MRTLSKAVKYAAIGRLSLRNQFAYVYDFLTRSLFMIIIMYIFIQLWRVTFQGEGSDLIEGYSYEQIIWYIIFAEAITLASPSIATRIEEEVKGGDVGYKLARPVSYIAMHYVTYAGEFVVRLLVNLCVGSLLGLLAFGIPHFGLGWVGFFAAAAGAMTVQFMLGMIIALCAFWVEETRGIEFVYNKLLFTIGGMLMPIEFMPDALQRVCAWLPFRAVLYFPSRTAVRFDAPLLLEMIGVQLLWIIVLLAVVALIYRKGVKMLHVNGG
jgi:ABC-2 type transport system permease protein